MQSRIARKTKETQNKTAKETQGVNLHQCDLNNLNFIIPAVEGMEGIARDSSPAKNTILVIFQEQKSTVHVKCFQTKLAYQLEQSSKHYTYEWVVYLKY